MNYYQIMLPAQDNSGKSYAEAHSLFRTMVVKECGGITAMSAVYGTWEDNGTVYHDRLTPYNVACSAEQWCRIVDFAFSYFPDQVAIFHAQIGTATIENRAEQKEVA